MTNSPLGAARPHMAHRRRMWWMVVSIALTLVLCFVIRLATPAHAQSPLITAWLAANAECRGGRADDPKTLQACEKRDMVSARLKRRGCLYQEVGDWWKCPH